MGYGLMGGNCFWGGWGGSMIMIDFDTRMTVSYVMNQMLDQSTTGDDRALSIVMAAYDGVSERALWLRRQAAWHTATKSGYGSH